MIVSMTKKLKRNLGMAWIDYKKAFDSVPHSWILAAIKIYHVSPTIIQFMEATMKKWKTEMPLFTQGGCLRTEDISIKRGIFQFDKHNTISYLLYMAFLKLFTKNEYELEQALVTVKAFSDDIKMEFGLGKCATAILKCEPEAEQTPQHTDTHEGESVVDMEDRISTKMLETQAIPWINAEA
ncbi:PREDICTED: uncharacterized protein LOC106819213 [Priapulus caudatus]|uniref:Uncharacterized protein LOC106819213 n=1 Tax=Priapulus caudatus TaxID=37621 RepID=A0ABM1F4H5_PRICU|nr:PREDICTED: uncharacterized protein LOC106819213 [Priapulus caudatus]